jgi:hypothetical protein
LLRELCELKPEAALKPAAARTRRKASAAKAH